ncbi:hypothetical protein EPR50_G00048420 [Perca flavescens]|uniref:Uncharacterized protein n=1 Tax=Perca flavescens TaxID=8167 RepID=A0A484DAR1_PERFV|nr:hypothetical protein EPR50_G00048420 [Perca flavescens]
MHCDVSVSLALTGLSYQQQRHSPTAASESSTNGRPRSSESLPELGGGRTRRLERTQDGDYQHGIPQKDINGHGHREQMFAVKRSSLERR